MNYQPYLIANFASGLNTRLQPWLLADDSQEELLDGYVYRGTLTKREGYSYFATGLKGGYPYTESRIVHNIINEATGQVNNGAVLTPITLANVQSRRGSVYVTDTVETHVDDGLGSFPTAAGGTINYITGVITGFQFNASSTIAVTVTYDYFPDNPVMMIASFYTTDNTRQSIVADTEYINRYNSTLNIYEDISTTVYTGTKKNFFSWVNYQNASSAPRLLFCNNVDVIQQYDGSAVAAYAPTSAPFTTITCLLLTEFKDRLILLRTTEDSVVYPRRIRISGAGAQCDDFNTTATGAGFIDIPDNTWIMGAAFNRDDLIIFTQGSIWALKYTGNETTPFALQKIDPTRGSQAPFAAITYLNKTSAASPRGLIVTDGYTVERQDLDIPDFSYNQIDGANFDLCFAGSVDADRDHYLIYPPPGQDQAEVKSQRILITNYDEDNYSIYRQALSCMGTFITSQNIDWGDLLSFANWDSFSSIYGNWNSFPYSEGTPISLGGGHHGEIWLLSQAEEEDNPVVIRNITIIDSTTAEVTTDWNNFSLNTEDGTLPADSIFITGVSGMLEINNQQYVITSIIDHNTFRITGLDPDITYSAFTTDSIGTAIRVIPFSALFKKFNPFVGDDKKVRCGWLYMYVNSTTTDLKRKIAINNVDLTDPCLITTSVNHNLNTGDQVDIFGISGTTELNNNQYFITVLSLNTFSLDGVDATAFTAYVSGGFCSVSEPAKIIIDIYVNDKVEKTQLNNLSQNPYQGNCTNITLEEGTKKWYKVFINQTGRFIQFRVSNQQAGTSINIQATMPGFSPCGRLI